jgi:hypothetical protein
MAPIIRRQIISAVSRPVVSLSRRSLWRPNLFLQISRNPSSPIAYTRHLATSIPRFQQAQAVEEQNEPLQSNSFSNFSDLENEIHPNLLAAIMEDMGLVTMTEVQQRTLSEALTGKDM